MITAYDVKRGLGSTFDFNCSVGFSRRDPDAWGPVRWSTDDRFGGLE
jgi:hypothetical protein